VPDRTVAATIAALLGVLLVTGCASSRDAVDAGAAGRNRFVAGSGTVERFPSADRVAAPRLAGTLLDGTAYDLRRQRGTVVVVNFWASWCAPCRLETPELVKVHRTTAPDGVAFLGINIRDDKDKALAFEDSFAVPYPSLFDPPGRTTLGFSRVSPNSIPATIVIDRQGRVAAVFRKAVFVKDLEPVVREIAAET
jgi:thiol-disulfide isomerase/thioredoxin